MQTAASNVKRADLSRCLAQAAPSRMAIALRASAKIDDLTSDATRA
jgi:hypothetical protein